MGSISEIKNEASALVHVSLVSSPGAAYANAFEDALRDATQFIWVTCFVSSDGLARMRPALCSVLERGGIGEIVVAVDRQGFNAAPVFEALLSLKKDFPSRLKIGIALGKSGLVHAKALLTRGPRGDKLVLGSANLTEAALARNHELGVSIDASRELRQAFSLFVNQIAPRSLNEDDAEEFLRNRSLLNRRRHSEKREPEFERESIDDIVDRLPKQSPLNLTPEEHLLSWIHRGYIVGRGRRSLEALVLRVPLDALLEQGVVRRPESVAISASAKESRSMSYSVNLVPTADADIIRRDTKRMSRLISKLSLALPCFGSWMPATYWDVFLEARHVLQDTPALNPEHVLSAAKKQRNYLDEGGLEREVDAIIERMIEQHFLESKKVETAKSIILQRFRKQVQLRTPSVLASCVEFRTARQSLTPTEHNETPYRQLMGDLMQATFASTYRTGDWPRRFSSIAARCVAYAIEQRLLDADREIDGDTAMLLLERSNSWEDEERAFEEVVDEFRRIVPDELEFEATSVEELVAKDEGDDVNDG